MTMSTLFPFHCTMNTYAPDLCPEKVIDLVARLGFAGCDLSCDGSHFPYTEATVENIQQAVASCGISLGNVNTMTTAFFWRDHGDPSAIGGNRFKGPDITDADAAYAAFGVPDSIQWRLDRIESCLQLAAHLGIPLFNMNVGSVVVGPTEDIWRRVLGALEDVLAMAKYYGVQPCIETEASLFIAGRPEIERVMAAFPVGSFCWGYDVGHQIKYYRGDHEAVARDIRELGPSIGYFHLEDISRSDWEGDPMKHKHLPIGDGDIDFIPILSEIRDFQTARIAQGAKPVPVYYENYNSFDTANSGSSGLFLERMGELVASLMM